MKFEYLYKTFNTVSNTQSDILEKLNGFGAEEWEMVGFSTDGSWINVVFKRESKETVMPKVAIKKMAG